MRKKMLLVILSFGVTLQSSAMPADLARGKLLYANHCISCHAVEIHWREKKLVSDWRSLKLQVNRWQKTAGLGWSEDEIEQVGAYLNETYYHFPAIDKVTSGRQGTEENGPALSSFREKANVR